MDHGRHHAENVVNSGQLPDRPPPSVHRRQHVMDVGESVKQYLWIMSKKKYEMKYP
jgi:hypothetical protein